MNLTVLPAGVELQAALPETPVSVLSPEALDFMMAFTATQTSMPRWNWHTPGWQQGR